MTAPVTSSDPVELVGAVRTAHELLRAASGATRGELSRLAADAAVLSERLQACRRRLADVEMAGLSVEATPAALRGAVAAALAATDLDAALRALRAPAMPVAESVAPTAWRVRLGLAFQLCAAALAGLAGPEATATKEPPR